MVQHTCDAYSSTDCVSGKSCAYPDGPVLHPHILSLKVAAPNGIDSELLEIADKYFYRMEGASVIDSENSSTSIESGFFSMRG